MTDFNKNPKRHWKNTIVLLLSIWLVCSITSTNGQCTTVGCVDCFDWCEANSEQYCHVGAVRANCRKSCKSCPTEAPACLELNCAQKCILSNDGSSAQCACDEGYELDVDGRTCNDIDECALNSEICQNNTDETYCKNIPGNYACLTCHATDNTRLWNYYNKHECCIRNQYGECGKSYTNGGRVVGGSDSPITRWPWTAYLKIGTELCGGTLISRRHVLTAAHCVWEVPPDSLRLITVLLGVDNVTDGSSVHIQARNAIRINIHPNYNFPSNDIAILELDQPAMTSGPYVNTICLSNGEEPQAGEVCYATGFGATSYGGRVADILQQVDLPIVDGVTCERAYQNHSNQVNSMQHICAGYAEGGKDTCQGDSGGPLVCQRCKNCDWYLAGITSFGRECARPNFYGVFTRTRHYEEWISGITGLSYISSHPTCVKATWHEWGSWTSCSATCGVGERTRIRICLNGAEGDPGCIGNTREIARCNAAACTTWSQWSSCSTTCGVGEERRDRLGEVQTRSCNIRTCPTWSAFGAWSVCSRTCGGGIRRASRECLNDVFGGGGCPGSNEITQVCNTNCCPHWSDFGSYSDCPVTCGGGFQIASRTCLCAAADRSGCDGEETSFRLCGTETCPNAVFSLWTDFGPCSATCNGGERVRTRTCLSSVTCDADEHGLATEQREICNTDPCTSGWTSWEDSGTCPKTCGNGSLIQTRQCVGGSPGDLVCPGETTRNIQCNLEDCPAEWGPYTSFSTCSATCGEGTQSKTRECLGGPVGTGNCIGSAREERSCNQAACPDPSTGGSTNNSGDCSSQVDIRDSSTCCNYAKMGYCEPLSTYTVYMAINCGRTCCEYTPGKSCETQGCSDIFPQTTCQFLVLACNTHAFVQQGCRATCGSC